jgi:hypothetical protein
LADGGMPSAMVVEVQISGDVAAGLFMAGVDLPLIHSCFRLRNTRSTTALSQQLPRRLMLCTMLYRRTCR